MFRYASRWCVGLAVVGLLIVATPGDRSDPPASIRDFDQPDAATRYAAMRRAPIRADLDMATVYDRAAEHRLTMQRYASRIDRSLPNLLPGRVSPTNVLDAWTPLGPGNVGGRTRVIRYHPTNHNVVFAAGVSGGVWKSEDEGTSWRPIAEGLANLAVNALTIDPRQPDTMYAGTGEGYFREDIRGTGLPLRGSGIFVTRDGGGSWQRLASTATDDFLWVNDLLLGIGDSRRLYAATRTGVWRSDDGGGRWSRLVSTTVRGGCLDLELRPDRNEDVLFASCGSYEQATVYRFASASTGSAPDTVLQQPGMGRTSLVSAGLARSLSLGQWRRCWIMAGAGDEYRCLANEHAAPDERLERDTRGVRHQREKRLHEHGLVQQRHRRRSA